MSGGRIHYLDWLKVLIVYGILVFHVALVFAANTWLVGNAQKSLVLTAFAGFCFPWGIPAMFLIAGADAWFGVRSRSAWGFLSQRALRLLVPMGAGLVVLSPLQRFVTSHNPPPPLSELPSFYVSFFQSISFQAAPEWVSKYWLHLWFLGYLFAISAFCLPLLILLHSRRGKDLTSFLLRIGKLPGGMLILATPLVVAQAFLRPIFPIYQSWADIATYTFVFAMGAIMIGDRRFDIAIQGQVRWILTAGLLSTLGLGTVLGSSEYGLFALPRNWLVDQLAYSVSWAMDVWAWNLAVLYLGIRWLNFPSRILEYLRESVLPFYVLHHPVVLAIASFVVTFQLGLWPKFGIILVSAFAVTIGLYELAVRRWRFMQTVFGLGPPVPPASGRPALQMHPRLGDGGPGGNGTWPKQQSFERGSQV